MLRRLLLAAAAAALLAPASAPAATPIALRGCLLTLHGHARPAEALRSWLPSGHRVAPYLPGTGLVVVWQFGCDGVRVGDGPERPAGISLAGVRVLPPDGRPDPLVPTIELANTWDQHVVAAATDHPELAAALSAAGFPGEHVPAVRFVRTPVLHRLPGGLGQLVPLHRTTVHVAAAEGAWSSTASGKVPQKPVSHTHDNHFWAGPDLRRLRVLVPSATDDLCYGTPLGDCGVVQAPAGTRMARLFGATRVAAIGAVDHDPIRQAWMLLG